MYHAQLDSHAVNDHLEALRLEAARSRLSASRPSTLRRLLALIRQPAHPTGTVHHT